MKKENKKILKTSGTIIGVLILIFLLYFAYLFVTVEGRIVEDEPLLELACKMRPLCDFGTGSFHGCETIKKSNNNILFSIDKTLSEGKSLEDFNQKELANWKGYKGCNNLTPFYTETENDYYIHKGIQGINSCSCKNLFG